MGYGCLVAAGPVLEPRRGDRRRRVPDRATNSARRPVVGRSVPRLARRRQRPGPAAPPGGRLAGAVPWQAPYRWLFRQRFLEPRLTAEYRRLADAPHPSLVAAGDALSRHYGVRYDNLWLNLYRSGEDSTGWHRDRFSCRRPECIVPVLTLGATRRFLVK